jgi:ACS family tartrate transporter-like MFS transporter
VEDSELGRRTMVKVGRRLIPFMIAMFCVNFLDRVNIGFAALQMNRDLGLTPEVYGFAAGILFLGYTAFEVPSNLILQRVGARIWLARIMITWGLLAAATAFAHDRYSLYALRTLLGIAEAGFFPGIMLYLLRWFPREGRAAAITLFMVGNPISVIFGAPLSTAILSLDGALGLAGWQWLFILEGVPAVALGIATLFWLTERPKDAHWLGEDERNWLIQRLAAEEQTKTRGGPVSVAAVFTNLPTLALSLSKFCVLLAFFGVTLWLPQIVKGMGRLSNFEVGLISAIPFIFSAGASVLIGRHSDRTGERTLHIALPAFIGTAGFVLAAYAGNPVLALAGLCIAATGIWVSNTVFWTLPAGILAGTPAAAGIALINSVGNLGGFAGPYLTGWIRGMNADFAIALVVLGSFLAVSGCLVLWLGRLMPTPARARPATP